MVFVSPQLFPRARGPDEFWRKRQIFKLAAHYVGRKRNCYSLAIRCVHRALVYATKARKVKKDNIRQLWETRIEGAAQEHGSNLETMWEGLNRCNVLLNRQSLATLAIWEPRTFKSLCDVSLAKVKLGDFKRTVGDKQMPKTVITRRLVDELD